MGNIIGIIFAALLTENVVLFKPWGICPFLGVSTKRKNAVGMGLAVTVVIFIATIVTWLLYNYVLVPLEIDYLRILVFILVIASLVQMLEMFLKKTSPSLYKALGIYLPLITTNCAVMGVADASVDLVFVEMLAYALFSGIGFLFVMFVFSSLRERINKAPVPEGFKGFPIALIAAAGLALIFSRLGGIV